MRHSLGHPAPLAGTVSRRLPCPETFNERSRACSRRRPAAGVATMPRLRAEATQGDASSGRSG